MSNLGAVLQSMVTTLLFSSQPVPVVLCGGVFNPQLGLAPVREVLVHAKGPQTTPGSLRDNARLACNGLLSHTFCKRVPLTRVKNKGLAFYLETIDWVMKVIVS